MKSKRASHSIKFLSLLVFAIPSLASAGTPTVLTLTGSQISDIVVNAEPADATLRVAIIVPTATNACVSKTFFATNPGLSEALRVSWLAMLKSAKAGNKSFVLTGTGTCDAYNQELIAKVDITP